jgi:hypothetical protein
MASSDRFVAVGVDIFLYIIWNIFAKPQVFYYLVTDAKIFDIIYQLSPLLECDPTVYLPEKSNVTQPECGHSNKGDTCIITMNENVLLRTELTIEIKQKA